MFSTSKFLVNPPSTVVTDPYFNYTTLLLNDTGTNGAQNNTFIDSSTNNFTITRNGNTTQGSFNPYKPTGYWGVYFDGSGYLVNSSSSSALGMGTSDFTMEAWLYYRGNAGGYNFAPVFTLRTNTTGTLASGDTNGLYFDALTASAGIKISGTTTNIGSGTAMPTNTWTHLALTRQSGTVKLFVNGVQSGSSVSISGNMLANYIQIGCDGFGAIKGLLVGYVSNLRFVKGTAVYTSNFTVPTAPLTAITNTSLLCLQDNRFKDNSSNNFTFSVTGTPKTTGFNPFAPPASYTTSAYGGSGYYDGSGDWLTAPNNTAFDFGSGNFTIECWVYSSTGYGGVLFGKRANTATNSGPFQLGFNTGNVVQFLIANNSAGWAINSTSTTAIQVGVWNHLALTRNGSSFTVWLNGASIATGTNSSALLVTTDAVSIGAAAADGGASFTSGYLSNVRIVKGTAVYTSAFTPPTTPLTAISGTSLLLNATNAGIYDATVLNDLETVNTAQVSTAQSKWGSGSIYFNGSSNLTFLSSQLFDFKSRSFTIEGWFYIPGTGTSGFQTILYKRSGGGTGIAVSLSYSASSYYQWLWIDGNYIFPANSGTAIPKNQWVHLAWVRNGSSFTTYINGVLNLSATNAISVATNTANLIIGGESTYSQWFVGYVDDYRITMDVARYTANFTPPTAPFPTR